MNFGGGGYQSYGDGGGGYGGSGGGGYMGGGGGGGFPSPGTTQSPSIDMKKKYKNQSVRPVTSRQIQQAVQKQQEDMLLIDGEDVGQVTLVGEIVEVSENQTNVTYKLDDRTGPLVEVRKWINEENDPSDLQRRASCREGIYVRVIGHLKSFNKQLSVVAFCIRPVDDFNELSNHLAEVIYAHLAITKGVSVPTQFADQQKQMADTSARGGSAWNPMATSTQMPGSNGGYGYSGARPVDMGLTPAQRQALSIIGQSGTDHHGRHIREVISIANQHGFSEQNTRSAIEFLCNEGHIYSTIDDEHFRSTDEI